MTTKNPISTREPRFQVPRGKIAPAAIVLLAQAGSLLGVIISFYILAFFAAVRVVPTVLGFVKDGTGITMDMPVETVLALWIAPSLFLLSLLFWFVVTIMRSIWALRTRLVASVKVWAFGREEAAVLPLTKAPRAATKRIRQTA